MRELTAALTGKEYDTKTRGAQHQEGARCVGEAAYVIAKGGRRKQTHIAFDLESPETPGEAQRVFNIEKEASFVLSIKVLFWFVVCFFARA